MNLVLASPQEAKRDGGWRGDLDNETYVLTVGYGGNRTGGPLDVAAALQAHGGPHGRQDFASETFLLTHTLRAEGHDASKDGTERGVPLVTGYAASGAGFWTDGLLPNLRALEVGTVSNAIVGTSVRRLTPIEAARLQAFPDDWLHGNADGPKYRALGNAVTVSVVEWIARRIMEGSHDYL